jgi:hypothetical protein
MTPASQTPCRRPVGAERPGIDATVSIRYRNAGSADDAVIVGMQQIGTGGWLICKRASERAPASRVHPSIPEAGIPATVRQTNLERRQAFITPPNTNEAK